MKMELVKIPLIGNLFKHSGAIPINRSKKIDSIKSPPMSSYVQWLYDMAYVEWSLDEMRKGLPWQHFRKHICKPT